MARKLLPHAIFRCYLDELVVAVPLLICKVREVWVAVFAVLPQHNWVIVVVGFEELLRHGSRVDVDLGKSVVQRDVRFLFGLASLEPRQKHPKATTLLNFVNKKVNWAHGACSSKDALNELLRNVTIQQRANDEWGFGRVATLHELLNKGLVSSVQQVLHQLRDEIVLIAHIDERP